MWQSRYLITASLSAAVAERLLVGMGACGGDGVGMGGVEDCAKLGGCEAVLRAVGALATSK